MNYSQVLAFQSKLERARQNSHLSTLALQSIWQPFPDSPQARAYACDADIIGYGGAAGGGKTDLGLGKGLTQFRRAILFRREFPRLKAVIERGNNLLAGRAEFVSGTKNYWRLPDGRTFEIAHMQHEKSKSNYQGQPHDFMVFDEATEFTETQFRFVTTWLRTDDPDIKPQILLTFNPPQTPDGEWVVGLFSAWLDDKHPNPAKPGELRYYITPDDKEIEVPDAEPFEYNGTVYTPQSRTFFPARVEDNPVYIATGYDKHLDSLPEPLRSQMRYGDFSALAKDDPWQVIPTAWVMAAQQRWLETPKPDVNMCAIGVDPAYGGADDMTIAPLYGAWFDEIVEIAGADVPDGATGARYVIEALGKQTAAIIGIDPIGWGATVVEQLEYVGGLDIRKINFGEGSAETDKSGMYAFGNLRAEAIWRFREALDPESGENICLPPSRRLRSELVSPHYKTVNGKIKIESKEDIRKRIGRSTNLLDAVVLAWYAALVPAFQMSITHSRYA